MFDRRVTIQSATEAADAFGQPVKTWADIADTPTMWAEVTPLRGRERFDAQAIDAVVDTTFRLRYRSDLNEEMRIVYDSRPYDIQSILEIGRQEGLEILTQARAQETV